MCVHAWVFVMGTCLHFLAPGLVSLLFISAATVFWFLHNTEVNQQQPLIHGADSESSCSSQSGPDGSDVD
jgi:hypothetical protein